MIKTLYFFLFVTIFSLGMWACTGKDAKYKNLTSGQFEQLIKDTNIQLVDVRTLAEHMEGHIPGSLNINVQDKEFASCVDDLLDKNRPIALYCRSGRRSRKAAELLIEKGYQKVYNLDKGILNWMEEGREVEK